MKKTIALVLVTIMVLSIAAVAFAACSHTWYHADTKIKSTKQTIAKPSGCIKLSNPHTHWRYQYVTTKIYVCSKGCGAIKQVSSTSYSAEHCPKD